MLFPILEMCSHVFKSIKHRAVIQPLNLREFVVKAILLSSDAELCMKPECGRAPGFKF